MKAPARRRCPGPAPRRCARCRPRAPSCPESTPRGPAGPRRRRLGIEAGSAVAHVERDAFVARIEEDTETSSTPECRAAFAIASRAASTSACVRSSSGASPVRTTSTRTPCNSSISAAVDSIASASEPSGGGFAVGVEPRAQLALLATCQTPCVGRILLDQRQRLQHGVVHARGEVGALLGANPCDALRLTLARETPRGRSEHDQQCRSHRAGSKQRRRGPARVVADEDHGSDDDENERGSACAPLLEPERPAAEQHGTDRDEGERARRANWRGRARRARGSPTTRAGSSRPGAAFVLAMRRRVPAAAPTLRCTRRIRLRPRRRGTQTSAG